MSGVPWRGGSEIRRRQEHRSRSSKTCGQRPCGSQLQGLPHRHQRVSASRQNHQGAVLYLPRGGSQISPRQRPFHARRTSVRCVSRKRARTHHVGKSDSRKVHGLSCAGSEAAQVQYSRAGCEKRRSRRAQMCILPRPHPHRETLRASGLDRLSQEPAGYLRQMP